MGFRSEVSSTLLGDSFGGIVGATPVTISIGICGVCGTGGSGGKLNVTGELFAPLLISVLSPSKLGEVCRGAFVLSCLRRQLDGFDG